MALKTSKDVSTVITKKQIFDKLNEDEMAKEKEKPDVLS